MILETIRREIETSRNTRYAISKETGVSQEQPCRPMHGRSLSCKSAENLLENFGFELKKRKDPNENLQAKIHYQGWATSRRLKVVFGLH
ncbi:MAG: hypothetical protein HQ515_23910 [Phycisphaeraceae bacterium]|nr:hypothetical protein [Phycisphaeraceae bacterium]